MTKKIFGISTFLLLSGLATAAVPSDVRAVDNAWELLQEQAKSDETVAALSEIVWQSCLMIARETNSVSAMRIDSDEFREFVDNRVADRHLLRPV
jgi:enoyl-CoA hydratase/carnithine racemase